jgi:hypothetical protein
MDLLALTEWVIQAHTGTELELPDGSFGHCRTCDERWPCSQWREILGLTQHWLTVASNTAVRRSQESLRDSQ